MSDAGHYYVRILSPRTPPIVITLSRPRAREDVYMEISVSATYEIHVIERGTS